MYPGKLKALATTIVVLLWSFCCHATTGKVIRVLDGDTFILLAEGRKVTVRLAVIDCPELHQPFGREALYRVINLVHGKTVRVDSIGTDRYHRTIAMVYCGKDTLNYQLLREGLAWHYKKYDNQTYPAALQRAAENSKAGLWACATPPWEFRKNKKKR